MWAAARDLSPCEEPEVKAQTPDPEKEERERRREGR